jgi:hypothetical protein
MSIIMCLNALKDKINWLGSLRFAKESNQKLVDFFSIDSLPSDDVKDIKCKKRNIRVKSRSKEAYDRKIMPHL